MPDQKISRNKLVLLKLGGSLITEKNKPSTPRIAVLDRLADEIAQALNAEPGLRLLVGHGSGSFGHVPAREYQTINGVYSKREWQGFIKVWRQAYALNRIVVEALSKKRLPAIAFPPSASVVARGGKLVEWNLAPISQALDAGLLPVIYGDVIFDKQIGGTIFSTEDLFLHLSAELRPSRILLAGLEEGVWEDFPKKSRLIPHISPQEISKFDGGIGSSVAADVTGGMHSKVRLSLNIAESVPGLEILIFSGVQPGSLKKALSGEHLGTLITAE